MKKSTIVFVFLVSLVGVGILLFYFLKNRPDGAVCTMDAKECPDGTFVGRVPPDCDFAPCPSSSPESIDESPTDYSARFEIYTNGTKRIFTSPMYHYRSEDSFIEADDPSLIQVRRTGVSWQKFFDTLPFRLTKTCLITGTNQTFCTDENGRLKFLLNGVETPSALDLIIQPEDILIVRYE